MYYYYYGNQFNIHLKYAKNAFKTFDARKPIAKCL